MLAEELEVPLESVDMVLGDTDLCPWDAGTFGSLSIRSFGPALRAAAAEAREVLCELAAEKLPSAGSGSRPGTGRSSTENPKTKVDLRRAGQGAGDRPAGETEARPEAALGIQSHGASPFRDGDARDKVTGAAKYAGDIRLPGMLYARVLRPPAHGRHLRRSRLRGRKGGRGACRPGRRPRRRPP